MTEQLGSNKRLWSNCTATKDLPFDLNELPMCINAYNTAESRLCFWNFCVRRSLDIISGGDFSELDSNTDFAYLLPCMKHGGGEVISKSLQDSS